MNDPVEQLAHRISNLEEEPVHRHPGVLDEVHRGLVGELERLAGAVAGDPRSASPGSPQSLR